MDETRGALVLRIWLAMAKMTQKDLSKEIGVSEPTVSYWINGDNEPTRENKVKIAEALSKRLSVILTADDFELDFPDATRLANALRAIGVERTK